MAEERCVVAWALAWSRAEMGVAFWLCCELSVSHSSSIAAFGGCGRLVPTEVSPHLGAAFYAWLGMPACLFVYQCLCSLPGFAEEIRDRWQ